MCLIEVLALKFIFVSQTVLSVKLVIVLSWRRVNLVDILAEKLRLDLTIILKRTSIEAFVKCFE